MKPSGQPKNDLKSKENNSKQILESDAKHSLSNNKTPAGKNKAKVESIVEEVTPPPIKIKNLERLIHVTTYSDQEFMSVLKELFEDINTRAFDLQSVKEIYTKIITEEERSNNELDYISGFQLIDSNLRITIIEGISGKAMKLVKERLPKSFMNDNTHKVFSDGRILFDERKYSKFDLGIKFIKLRDTLNHILTTYDIYMKAKKYNEIYNAFMNFGFILESATLSEISHADLFPPADRLLLLERKYGDILVDADLTGVSLKIKKTKTKTRTKISTNESRSSTLVTREKYENSKPNSERKSVVLISEKKNNNLEVHTYNPISKIDSKNYEYIKHKELEKLKPKRNAHGINLQFLNNLNLNVQKQRFCRYKIKNEKTTVSNENSDSTHYDSTSGNSIDKNEYLKSIENNDEEVYLYSNSKKNYYSWLIDKMRQEILKDKNNFYTYSKDYLTLSFPMENERNIQYEEFLNNKKKWIDPQGRDFNRYTYKAKEYIYLPKINNIL